MNLFIDSKGSIVTTELFVEKLSPYIKHGDIISLEMDLMTFGNFFDVNLSRNSFLEEIYTILRMLVGPEGHIVIPSFSYSWGMDKEEKKFDLLKTPGKVGIFPEFFRKNKNVKRTIDPMFSLLVEGPLSSDFSSIQKSSFGGGSLYEKLYKSNAKLISFGLKQFDPTFVHYVEQYFDENISKIDYRFLKKFEGTIVDHEKAYYSENYSFMRHPGSPWFFTEKKIVDDLKSKNKLSSISIGDAFVHIATCKDFFEIGLEGMKNDPHYFVKKKEI